MYITGDDRARLRTAQDTLLNPHRYPSAEGWLRAVNLACKTLLNAPHSSFLFFDGEQLHYYSEDSDSDAIDFLKRTIVGIPDEGAFLVDNDLLQLGHIARRRMGPNTMYVEAFHDSIGIEAVDAFNVYNEVIVPAKLAYPIALSMPTRQGEAVLSLLFEEPPSSDRIERGVYFTQSLLPAFVTGVNGYLAGVQARNAVFASFESIPAGIVVYDSAGRQVFHNQHWQMMLGDETRRSDLSSCADALASRMLVSHAPRKSQEDNPAISVDSFVTPLAAYHAQAFLLPEHELGRPFVAVYVTRRVRGLLCSVAIRYGLSRRECEIAELVLEGKPNKTCAAELHISIHTVRRHVESILHKTHAPTRQALMAHLLEVA
jgi:DNA-binding CsgD family transcriptional regulator